MSGHGRRHLPRSHVFPALLCLLHIFTAAQGYADNSKYVNSTTCQARCALFIHPSLKPKCQCDGLCGINVVKVDCCKDYEKICMKETSDSYIYLCVHTNGCRQDYEEMCQKETVPKQSSDLVVWVATIVGCVFAVVIVLAIVYFCLIQKKDTRRMSIMEVGGARYSSGGRSPRKFSLEPPAM